MVFLPVFMGLACPMDTRTNSRQPGFDGQVTFRVFQLLNRGATEISPGQGLCRSLALIFAVPSTPCANKAAFIFVKIWAPVRWFALVANAGRPARLTPAATHSLAAEEINLVAAAGGFWLVM